MKDFLTIKNVLILIGALYIIVIIERLMQTPGKSETLIEYQQKKIDMQNDIINLTNKVHQYESIIIQNSIDILNMSSSERDSARALYNPR